MYITHPSTEGPPGGLLTLPQSSLIDRLDCNLSLDKLSGCLRETVALPWTGEIRTPVLAGQAQGLEEERAEG